MACVAVDKDGEECIYSDRPIRHSNYFRGEECVCIALPPGSIEKLTGKILTWADEPVEI